MLFFAVLQIFLNEESNFTLLLHTSPYVHVHTDNLPNVIHPLFHNTISIYSDVETAKIHPTNFPQHFLYSK
jgi:hypothetical protein